MENINKYIVENPYYKTALIICIAFISQKIGDNLSGLFMSLDSGYMTMEISSSGRVLMDRASDFWYMTPGYGISGAILGFVLFKVYKNEAEKICYFLPIYLWAARMIYIFLISIFNGRIGSYSIFRYTENYLTSAIGFYMFVLIALFAYLSVIHFKKKSTV